MSFLKWVASGEVDSPEVLCKVCVYSDEELEAVTGVVSSVEEILENTWDVELLASAFVWVDSPQGEDYWSRIYRGQEPLSHADLNFLQQLLDYLNRGGGSGDWEYLDEEDDEEEDDR